MLQIHRAEGAEALVGPLASLLAGPRDDAFAPEVISVPTRGIERWLAQRLSHRLGALSIGTSVGEAGICAGVVFDSPSRLTAGVLSELSASDPDDDPWAPERLVWPLLDLIDTHLGEPWCASLAHHLGADADEPAAGRRLAVAGRLARLFASYATQRPSLVRGWATGDRHAATADAGDLAWQVELWHRLRERLATPSPAERLAEVEQRLLSDPTATTLPGRISIFGATRLPETQLRLLVALSRHRDVHLWLPHPSPALWRSANDHPRSSPRRADSPVVARHPFLASMARDSIELQQRLTTTAEAVGIDLRDVHHDAPDPGADAAPTMLAALHRALAADDPTPGRHRFDPTDRSVQVHACHGRARQVEVLREIVTGLLADDPTLHPRDIVVMVPDVEAIAPLISATFGLGGAAVDTGSPGDAVQWHPGQHIPIRLADRSLRQTNAHLALLATLLDLPASRLTASELLDLAAAPAVRHRFGFTDDDLARLRTWVIDAGIRWGEDAERRARFGLAHVLQGTWQFGLDRILTGVAIGGDEAQRYLGTALPLDDVESTDVDLAGRLAELVDRLSVVLGSFEGAHPVAAWMARLGEALDLLAGDDPDAGWQGVEARRLLVDLTATAADHEALPLRLPDVRSLLAGHLVGRPTRAGFRTGALTVCSLEPMRAVPHRVVCLLGLDDATFPRSGPRDGDDLLLRDPWIGERDRRSEDRQLFLDAVLAAREHLVVLYSGADERLGTARPPAVPVGELLDALDRTAATDDGSPVREHLTVHHPLQPVDERNFTPAALGRPGPFSRDAHAYRAAVRARDLGPPVADGAPRVLLPTPLPVRPVADDTDDGSAIDLDDLIALLEHPARWFVRTQLGVWLPGEDDEVDDHLPLQLDGLQKWKIGDRLLQACLAGVDHHQALGAENRRGVLPPRRLGRTTLEQVDATVLPIARAAREHLDGDRAGGGATDLDVAVDLPGGGRVTGTVTGVVGQSEGRVVRATFSRLGAKHRLRAWVQLLALAADGRHPVRAAVTIGRAGGRRPAAAVATLTAPSEPVALQRLGELVRLRRRALREPLPMPADVALAYARCRHGGDAEEQALAEAARAWDRWGMIDDAYHVLCWGEAAPLRVFCGAPSRDEQAWSPHDGTRLGVYARRVWDPLLAHEEVLTR
ncbi:MAG: exodeoxyribonuclease V subunit gamma [Kineosporiaceae bacterium]